MKKKDPATTHTHTHTHKRHGGNIYVYYQVKEANLKRVHAIWFQLSIFGRSKTIGFQKFVGGAGGGGVRGCISKLGTVNF
jgi:hypothetical protein